MAKILSLVPIGTIEYFGQFFVELAPNARVNGLRKAGEYSRPMKSGLERIHFPNGHIVLYPNRETVEFRVHSEVYTVEKNNIALITHPGAQGAFLKHPDYEQF